MAAHVNTGKTLPMLQLRTTAMAALAILVLQLTGCRPTAPQGPLIGPAATSLLSQPLACYYYATCPPNPTMGAPCFSYHSGDTVTWGSGQLYFSTGPGNILYRTTGGSFKTVPYSYVYRDSMAFDVLSDSVLLLQSNTPVRDTLKITAVTGTTAVLKYISGTYGFTVETDSLKR